jgi:phosphoenolpyruvate synthase/pyruvate phosphate dikinase
MKDVLWVTRTELYKDIKLQLLNPGKAYGTLRVMSPEELDKAVVSFNDILVLTRLPNSLPIVGGTITEELQTPLAHVNLMAQSRGTPNIALLGASLDPRIAPFVDKLVKFEVGKEGFSISETTLAEAQKYWDSLKKDPFFPEHDDEVEGLPTFAEFGFADSRAFGVKAANLAEMTHIIPDSTPDGFGVPFHYYDQFMATAKATPALCEKAREDCVKEGRSEEICGQALGVCKKHAGEGAVFWDYVTALLADKDFKGETLLREACLDNLVWMIRNSEVDPEFGAMLDARVAELMGDHKIRLRSSTNSEDLPHFSGAGLYVSVSAVAAGEKAASKRILEVWASIWKWKPFEERAFWNIDHLSVRMGICASRSFPDEQANGVLITQNIADPFSFGYYVNVQLGEISVTNPEDGSTPEAFSILPKPGGGIQIARLYFSSLSPDKAILADGEVTALYDTCRKVQKHFAKLYDQDPYYFALDVEFKFEGPERKLYLKQVRPYAPKSEL